MGSEIHKCLSHLKRTVTWLADELDCDQSNLNKKLLKRCLHPDLVFHISQVLGVDLFACYSRDLEELEIIR